MKITTKSGNVVTVNVDAKTITLPNGETRAIECVSAEFINFKNGRCEVSKAQANAVRAAVFGWVAPTNSSKEARYDAIMNEGAEGFNPYRDNASIALNIEACD